MGGNRRTKLNISSVVISTDCTLKVLHVQDNHLTAQAASSIADIIIVCLEGLGIDRNKLREDGTDMLSKNIMKTRTLTWLNVATQTEGSFGN